MHIPESCTKELRALGRELRRQRQDTDISLDKLAGLIGIDKSHISRIERGQVRPRFEMLTDWVSAINGNLDRVCLAAGVIPPDVCKRVAECPDLLNEIRELIF